MSGAAIRMCPSFCHISGEGSDTGKVEYPGAKVAFYRCTKVLFQRCHPEATDTQLPESGKGRPASKHPRSHPVGQHRLHWPSGRARPRPSLSSRGTSLNLRVTCTYEASAGRKAPLRHLDEPLHPDDSSTGPLFHLRHRQPCFQVPTHWS